MHVDGVSWRVGLWPEQSEKDPTLRRTGSVPPLPIFANTSSLEHSLHPLVCSLQKCSLTPGAEDGVTLRGGCQQQGWESGRWLNGHPRREEWARRTDQTWHHSLGLPVSWFGNHHCVCSESVIHHRQFYLQRLFIVVTSRLESGSWGRDPKSLA